jgi:hypothetical protein
MTEGSRISRKHRITRRILQVLAVLVAAGLASFLWMRRADRHAWPEALTDVRLSAPPPAPVDAAARNAWDVLRQLVATNAVPAPLSADMLAELRRFEAQGVATNTGYPVLDAWLLQQTNALAAWSTAAHTGYAWCSAEDAQEVVPVLLRIVELGRLSAYRAATAVAQGDWNAAKDRWSEALRVARHVEQGQGAIGLFIAFNVELAVCRDLLANATEHDIPQPIALELMERLRESETLCTPLPEALRRDRDMSHRALAALYTPRSRDMAPETARRHPPAHALRVARWLGSTPEASAAHFDAVCSHVLAAAERPYSPDGLLGSLPRWCRMEKRAPWTRDPIGALVCTVFIRNVAASAAYLPSRRAELRAARIALALNQARQAHPDRLWPVDLNTLAPQGLDAQALLDPFATGDAPFVYRSNPDGWVFHSVGLDQQDNGGTNDLFSASVASEADIVYTSAERARRLTSWRAAGSDPALSQSSGVP